MATEDETGRKATDPAAERWAPRRTPRAPVRPGPTEIDTEVFREATVAAGRAGHRGRP